MSRITKAVILAAGMGLRMKEMGEEIPKGFIRLGGSPIIEHSLRALISCGIKEIMIVTGHKGGYYENLKETYCPAAIQPSQDRLGSNIAGIFSSSPSCFVFSYTPEEQKIYWGKRKIVNLITEQTTNSPDRIPHN